MWIAKSKETTFDSLVMLIQDAESICGQFENNVKMNKYKMNKQMTKVFSLEEWFV